MAQIAKTVAQAEIRSSPDKFYGFFNNNVMQLIGLLPNFFKSGQLLQGQESCVGSVMLWKYVLVKITLEVRQGFANWTFEYEKAFEGAPSMDDYVNVGKMVTKTLDAYLLTH